MTDSNLPPYRGTPAPGSPQGDSAGADIPPVEYLPVADGPAHSAATPPPVTAPPASTPPVSTPPVTNHEQGSDQGSSSAKDEARNVASDASDAAKNVAGSAKEQAAGVASEAKSQARDLFHQTTSELRDQAATQQTRVAEGLRTVGEHLQSMADNGDQGVASDVVRQVSTRASSLAGWLDDRDPGSLLSEVRSYAARKPGTFIALALVGGVVAGRLTSSLVSNAKDEAEAKTDSGSDSGSGAATTAGTPYVDTTVTAPVPPSTTGSAYPAASAYPTGGTL